MLFQAVVLFQMCATYFGRGSYFELGVLFSRLLELVELALEVEVLRLQLLHLDLGGGCVWW